jgi:Cu-Zn family superoxide dismutase
MRLRATMMGLIALPLAGCMNSPMADPTGPGPEPRAANASIRNAAGLEVGQATSTQAGDSIRLRVEATRMPQGTYGAHIHAVGRCDAPDFASAGPHWNPTGRQHGKNNPAGMHLGDLPNLLVGADGRGSFEVTVPRAWVRGGSSALMDADGAAIVVHERPDDFRTDPSGNSGARIGCGVFG